MSTLRDKAADELVYHLSRLPQKTFTVAVEYPCPGSVDTCPDPVAYPQLLLYFMFQTISNPIQLNVLETNTVTDFPVSPLAQHQHPPGNPVLCAGTGSGDTIGFLPKTASCRVLIRDFFLL